MLNFNLFYENHLKIFLPEIYIITIVLFLLIVGVIFSNLRKYKYPFFVQEMNVLTILTLFFTLLLIFNNFLNNIVIFNNLFIVDDFAKFFKILALFSTIGCLVISRSFVKKINI